jgi:lysophospholipase
MIETHRVVPRLEERFLEPPGFEWGSFESPRGVRLRWGRLPVPGADKTCVLVGGFVEFIEKYFETARDFAARGFDVWCLDWYGQGGSQRPENDPSRPLARDFSADAEDLAAFVQTIVPQGKPRLLTAHSMGGAIGLQCMARHTGLFNAAILSAPMLGIVFGSLPSWLVGGIVDLAVATGQSRRFVPGAGAWKADPDLSPATSHTSNDARRGLVLREWFLARPQLRVDGATYGWVHASMAFIRYLMTPDLLGHITTPILIGSAGRELFVAPAAHRVAAKLLPDCRLVEFPDAKHELFMEADAVRVPWFAAIDEFVRDRLMSSRGPLSNAAQ